MGGYVNNRLLMLMLGAWCAFMGSPAGALDTTFIAIDQIDITYPSEGKGVEPSPFIVWKEGIFAIRYHASIMTLRHTTGAQLGGRLEVSLPDGVIPVDIMWSDNFDFSPGRGVGPSPFVLGRNFTLYAFPVTYALDGTPTAGAIVQKPIPASPINSGYPTCMMELPGSFFGDLKPRLYIGTEFGFVLAVVEDVGGGMQVENSFFLPPPAAPVRDLEPIPQHDYIAVGALRGNFVYGLSPTFTDKGNDAFGRDAVMFTLVEPGPTPPTHFDVFAPDDQLIPMQDIIVRLILADGTADLALASMSASQSGSLTLSPTIDTRSEAVRSIVVGSLLLLAEDGSAVSYDPGYSESSGSGLCAVNITDGDADVCASTCGDPNGDEAVNLADAVYLINYVFKGGPAPNPSCVADANGDDAVNLADAVYLINYIFKAGPTPVDPCCP